MSVKFKKKKTIIVTPIHFPKNVSQFGPALWPAYISRHIKILFIFK